MQTGVAVRAVKPGRVAVRREHLRYALERGALVGGVLVFIALIGAFTAFSQESVVRGVISLTQVLLLAGGLMAGQQAQRPLTAAERRSWAPLLYGALAGALAMLVLGLLAALLGAVNMRKVLVNATPDLARLLTLGMAPATGAAVLIAGGAVLGALGGATALVPGEYRRALVVGLLATVTLGVLRERGLDLPAALVMLAVVSALAYGYRVGGPAAVGGYRRLERQYTRPVRLLVYGGGLALLLVLPMLLGIYATSVIDLVGLYILMGLGLNIVVGYAGLLNLGYVAFFAIGAYVTGILTSPSASAQLGLTFWVAWPVAMAVAALAAILLGVPVLRMRGDYLAIVTLGFGEIIRILILSDTLKPILGGAQGIIEIPSPAIGSFIFTRPQHFYYLILLGCLVVVLVSRRISDSRIGRAWVAMREDEDVAEANGVNLVRYKLLAFAMGASFAGIGGAIFASWMHAVFPNSFTLLVSINILSLVIVGGLGSIPGVIVGALVLVGLPEVLRAFAEFRMLSFGALLVIMMLARPEGLWPAQRRRRELAEARE